jgi:hypothetical protein
MSALDQPLLIANSNYHVGHQIAIFVAKEQGFFREENLAAYDYEAAGLIPGPLEADGLALAMKNRGVDIATAVDVEAAIIQRAGGADLFIVGGWRYTPFLKWYGARRIKNMSDLLGGRIGMREKGGLVQVFVQDAQASIPTRRWNGFTTRSSATATAPRTPRCSAAEKSTP